MGSSILQRGEQLLSIGVAPEPEFFLVLANF